MTVERLLAALAPAGGTVLDPFVGSGTTLFEAARAGHPSVGLDVNPAAIAFAQCAVLASLPIAERKARLKAAQAIVRREGSALPGRSQTIHLAHALALLGASGSIQTASDRLTALIDELPAQPTETRVLLGDARDTGLEGGCADFVITSPPYINVFNYHQVGRPLSDAFGWPVLAAARSEIGSNRQNRSNRFRTVVQYSIDMGLTIAELARLMRTGASAVLVLGRVSRIRGVAFLNGEIVGRLAERMKAFERLGKGERYFVSRYGETIAEDILVVTRSASASLPDEAEVVEFARSVGREALERAAPSDQTAEEIDEAIGVADSIFPSPVNRADLDLS